MNLGISKIAFLTILAIGITNAVYGQSLQVGIPHLEDYYRRLQLMGQIDSTISFCVRPFSSIEALKGNWTTERLDNWTTGRPDEVTSNPKPETRNFSNDHRPNPSNNFKQTISEGLKLVVLPISWQQQWNSHHPYSLNDGAMIPARGYQTMLSGGFFAKLGPLSIQLYPELVYAENRHFDSFTDIHRNDPAALGAYNGFHSLIDLPEYFPDKPYKRLFPGQSSIRLNFGPVSAGISTENLWWGPGMYNSLLMTNSAAGFSHFTLNTIKPLRTIIGSIEGQIVSGKLESSGTAFSENKRNDWRYFNGIVLSYQPRWIPGLFLGGTRSFLIYYPAITGGFLGYFPIFEPNSKTNLYGGNESVKPDDQRISVFARWFLPKDLFEAYFEFGHEDGNYNMRDFLVQIDHTRAYVLGIRKIFLLNRNNQHYLSLNFEMTQLEQNMIDKIRASAYFYSHGQLTQGYTHLGQLLGAGIGPGSNLQTISLSWGKGLDNFGFELERFVHNNDLYYQFSKDNRGHWVDINLAFKGQYHWKSFLFTGQLEGIRSFNYEYSYVPAAGVNPKYWTPGKDVYNFQLNIGTSYWF